MKYIHTNSLKMLFSLKRRSLEDLFSTSEDEKSGFSVVSSELEPSPRPTWRCFSYEEIFDATNGFIPDNLVGKAGYAEVYKGVSSNGEEIAVKRLAKTCSDERKEKEFLTEIGTIGHVWIVRTLLVAGRWLRDVESCIGLFSFGFITISFLLCLVTLATIHLVCSAHQLIRINQDFDTSCLRHGN